MRRICVSSKPPIFSSGIFSCVCVLITVAIDTSAQSEPHHGRYLVVESPLENSVKPRTAPSITHLYRYFESDASNATRTFIEKLKQSGFMVDPLVAPNLTDVTYTVERGHALTIEGDFRAAIGVLESRYRAFIDDPRAMIHHTSLRTAFHQTLLLLAQAYLRLDNVENAHRYLDEGLRSFPEIHTISRREFDPVLVKAFEQRKQHSQKVPPVSFTIATDTATSAIFLDERRVGTGGVTLHLAPGTYRIVVEDNAHLSWFKQITVPLTQQLSVALAPSRHVRASPQRAILLADNTEPHRGQRALFQRFAQHLAQHLTHGANIDRVVLLKPRASMDTHIWELELIDIATNTIIVSTILKTDHVELSANDATLLGNYLTRGVHDPALTSIPFLHVTQPWRDPTLKQTSSSSRYWPWILLGTSALALGGSIPLWLIDDTCTTSPTPTPCPTLYNTKPVSIGLTIGGALSLATAIWLYVRQPSTTNPHTADNPSSPRFDISLAPDYTGISSRIDF